VRATFFSTEDPMTLGSKVRDTITGFSGIATARCERLHGSATVLVEQEIETSEERAERLNPPAPKEGMAMAIGRLSSGELRREWFEESRLNEL
jgi:hypothetical protein